MWCMSLAFAEAPMVVTSPQFAAGASIPRVYTCQGSDTSPPLVWSEVPVGAKSLALVVDDPDAPDPAKPQRVWVHWVLYNVPATVTGLAAGAALPEGARAGKNDWGKASYGGPCPPIGRHRYFFHLYALDMVLPDLRSPTKAELERAMEGHVLAKAELIGTYQKE